MYADVRELTAEQLRADLGYLPDVVVGSPPCQEISAANTKERALRTITCSGNGRGRLTGVYRLVELGILVLPSPHRPQANSKQPRELGGVHRERRETPRLFGIRWMECRALPCLLDHNSAREQFGVRPLPTQHTSAIYAEQPRYGAIARTARKKRAKSPGVELRGPANSTSGYSSGHGLPPAGQKTLFSIGGTKTYLRL
jgi:hypothetical protein